MPGVASRATRRLRPPRVRPVIDPVMPRWWDVAALGAMSASLALLLFHASVGFGWARGTPFLVADNALCACLLVDWIGRASRSQDRKRFLQAHWVELVASVPLVGPWHVLRAARFVGVLRILRVGVLARRMTRRLSLPARSLSLLYLVVALLSLWGATALAFYAFEHGQNPAVRDVTDALWWGVVTMSTIGYGDLYPVSSGGRVVAGLTMAIAKESVGRSWRELAGAELDRGRTALGLARASEVIVNPRPDLTVEPGDELFVVCEDAT